jgi:hypothetical protein
LSDIPVDVMEAMLPPDDVSDDGGSLRKSDSPNDGLSEQDTASKCDDSESASADEESEDDGYDDDDPDFERLDESDNEPGSGNEAFPDQGGTPKSNSRPSLRCAAETALLFFHLVMEIGNVQRGLKLVKLTLFGRDGVARTSHVPPSLYHRLRHLQVSAGCGRECCRGEGCESLADGRQSVPTGEPRAHG